MVAAEVQANQRGVSRAGQHGVREGSHRDGGEVQVGGVQRDGDRHGHPGSEATAVHSGEAEAVEEAETLHFAAAARVTALHRTGLD